MKPLSLFFFLFFLSFNSYPQAQPTTNGCYIQCTNCVRKFYVNNTGVTNGTGAANGFVYNTILALNSSTTCPRVATFGSTTNVRCYGPSPTYESGIIYNTYTINYCPLDDYIWLLILPLGVFGFYTMRKSSLLNLA